MMIEAKGIEKSFGTLKVLKGVDFSAEKSEVVSIMGASGAGKSTLLQILGTLSTPDAGSLVIDGIDVLHLNSRQMSEFRNTKIGFVFQFHHLLPEFTSIENVMIPALIAGKKEKEAKKKQKTTQVKEIRLSTFIEDHDIMVKAKTGSKFLKDGDKLKVSLRFRGREKDYVARGMEVMNKFAEAVSDVGDIDRKPNFEGRSLTMILTPKSDK